METTKKKGLRPWRELSGLRKLLRVLWIFVLAVLAATALLFGYLTATEFKPAAKENLGVTSGTDAINKVDQGKELSILTWNIGYGALGDNADFFMDGGKSVKTADEKRVMENMKGISEEVSAIDPDFAFFQEVDRDSHRSSGIDEARLIRKGRSNGDSTFAYNFRVKFIPYPVPPIGKVNSGILTSSDYKIQNSVRRQLYCPFKWPVSLGNLKRCLMVDRVKINGSSKELVLINLHLEAYDSGTGKIKQTKMLRDVMDKERAKGNYVIAEAILTNVSLRPMWQHLSSIREHGSREFWTTASSRDTGSLWTIPIQAAGPWTEPSKVLTLTNSSTTASTGSSFQITLL